MSVQITGLFTYPIKSCAPIEHSIVDVNQLGLGYDRQWMLIGNRGQMITQRTDPVLALAQTAIVGPELQVSTKLFGDMAIPIETDSNSSEIEVSLFKKDGSGSLAPAAASSYFSELVQKEVRLVRIKRPRKVNPSYARPGASDTIAFQDGFPILLTSSSSLAALNALSMNGDIPMDRFRPNIIVSDDALPAFAEDNWQQLRGKNLRAFIVRACARCPIPNVDQATGVLPDSQSRVVSELLKKYRAGYDATEREGKLSHFFGQNVTYQYELGQQLAVGDTLRIRCSNNSNVMFI